MKYRMEKEQRQIASKLVQFLGEEVQTPKGKMILVEIYYNGNAACLPPGSKNYYADLQEFHIQSITTL